MLPVGNSIGIAMHVIARRRLREFWAEHPQAEKPLKTWYKLVEQANWKGPADAKMLFGAIVDFVGDDHMIFDIGGNKFRLVVHVAYRFGRYW